MMQANFVAATPLPNTEMLLRHAGSNVEDSTVIDDDTVADAPQTIVSPAGLPAGV